MSSLPAGSHPRALLSRVDPRRSLVAAIGWALVALTTAGAWAASVAVGDLARSRLEVQTGELFKQYALQISGALDNNLADRLQWMRAMAEVLGARRTFGVDESARRRVLERMQASLPEIEWAAVTSLEGEVLAATDPALEGTSVAGRAWLAQGVKGAWIGEVDRPPSPREIALAAPIRDARGNVVGVLAARLAWRWAEALEATLTDGLKSTRPVESLVVDADGTVLIGPAGTVGTRLTLPVPHTPGSTGPLVRAWADGVEYVAGYAVSDGAGAFGGLGWTVWVREPTTTAFASARALKTRILLILLALGLAGSLLATLGTRRLTRGLAAIARSADAIRAGRASAIAVPRGHDEAARIGESLRQLVEALQRERSALQSLNAELDARVAARTREVERLSEENKHAAVVRERLRLARELHDTLAHSMMALLTEIRVLRKMTRGDRQVLEAELGRAEVAAREGLDEARAAIAALRDHSVRDIGLGASLAQLVKRFETRTGVSAPLAIDDDVRALADSRAEVLYRIVEEALRNAERHAAAARVSVSAVVRRASDRSGPVLELAVADDGIGFEPSACPPGHFGLRGMREQAELVGASIRITSAPGQGTAVEVSMAV